MSSDILKWLSNIKHINNQMIKLQKDLNNNLSKESLQKIGDYLVDLVKSRVKDGKGVLIMGGNEYTFPPLTEAYQHRRESFPLSSDTTPTKSNLHLTGDMINSIYAKIEGGDIIVTVSSKNIDKVIWAEENGRSFLYLSKSEYKAYEDLLNKEIDKAITKFLKG